MVEHWISGLYVWLNRTSDTQSRRSVDPHCYYLSIVLDKSRIELHLNPLACGLKRLEH